MGSPLLEAQASTYNMLWEAAQGLVIEFDYCRATTTISEREEVELEDALKEVSWLYGEESSYEAPVYPEEIKVLCMIAIHKQRAPRIKVANYPDGETND